MFEVYLLKSAERELGSLPKKVQTNITKQVKALAHFPDVRDCKKISGYTDTFRLRVGSYRVLFKIYSDENAIVVNKIGHRGRVYKGL